MNIDIGKGAKIIYICTHSSTYIVVADIPKEKVKHERNVNTPLFAIVSTAALHGISGNRSIVQSLHVETTFKNYVSVTWHLEVQNGLAHPVERIPP
jgi:hypothetical protein